MCLFKKQKNKIIFLTWLLMWIFLTEVDEESCLVPLRNRRCQFPSWIPHLVYRQYLQWFLDACVWLQLASFDPQPLPLQLHEYLNLGLL